LDEFGQRSRGFRDRSRRLLLTVWWAPPLLVVVSALGAIMVQMFI
jgi:hypothetical protein